MKYNYVYTSSSDVFHKPTCSRVLAARRVSGTMYYTKVEQLGKRPCKVCCPQPTDEFAEVSDKMRRRLADDAELRCLPEEERRAIKRRREAQSERERLLGGRELTSSEKNDIYTLTQSGCAFFAAAGYKNFHLYGCKKLHGLQGIRGFSTFGDAVAAGYKPCCICKPSKKRDIVVSVPIDSRVRLGEKACDLEPLCAKAGYAYHYEDNFFCLETAAGKWRIDLTSSPVRLWHINLVLTPNCTQYHKQPKIFLSLVDAFKYIDKHDRALGRRGG